MRTTLAVLAVLASLAQPARSEAGGPLKVKIVDGWCGKRAGCQNQRVEEVTAQLQGVAYKLIAGEPASGLRETTEVWYRGKHEADAEAVLKALSVEGRPLAWKDSWKDKTGFDLLVVVGPPASADLIALLPKFSQYPALPGGSQRAPLNFASNPGARNFSTRIREGYEQGANFAGRLVLVQWGCGSGCQSSVLVDTANGAIHDLPTTSEGIWYRADSNLLVVDPVDKASRYGPNIAEYLTTRFLVWEKGKLREVATSRVSIDGAKALE
jgi:hypothetical protein